MIASKRLRRDRRDSRYSKKGFGQKSLLDLRVKLIDQRHIRLPTTGAAFVYLCIDTRPIIHGHHQKGSPRDNN
jgi:hypothetical protein